MNNRTIGHIAIQDARDSICVCRDDPKMRSDCFWLGKSPVMPFEPLAWVCNIDGVPVLMIHTGVADKFGISIVMDDGNTEAKRVDYHVVETCPHCETEISLAWSPKDDGFEIYCPKCGEKIMLCDACFHLDEYDVEPDQQHPPGSCDWCEETGCWRKNRAEG